MIVMIAGSTHTGKTAAAQTLIKQYHYPSLSLDHLKMGLIRSGHTTLTPEDDLHLTELLWPIVKEMIKTAIENEQNMIIEGCYIPYDWNTCFSEEYLKQIKFVCLIMSPMYIEEHFDDIIKYANVIEKRKDDSYCVKELLLRDNLRSLALCKQYGCEYILIEDKYNVEIDLGEGV